VTRSPRLVGAVAAPALAVVLTLMLSGCGTPEAGSAATVGSRRISVAQVQAAYRDIVPVVGQDQGITQTQILNLLILEPYLTQAAASEGRGVSDQDAELDIKAAGPTVKEQLSHAALEVWRANLANSAIQSNRTTEQIKATYDSIGVQLKKAGVHVNPRYGGGIDYTNFSITPSTSNWLVTKAPAATAAPATPGATPTP
jgi:hypothetical protein